MTTSHTGQLASHDTRLDTTETQITAINQAAVDNTMVYESSSAATSHTITHNMGSNMLVVGVWVQDPNDNLYRLNPFIEVVETTSNQMDVNLNEASNVRVVLQNPLEVMTSAQDVKKYEAVSNATTHTLTHNFNTTNLIADVWYYRPTDGLYVRSPLVDLVILDSNRIQASTTVSGGARVKIIVKRVNI